MKVLRLQQSHPCRISPFHTAIHIRSCPRPDLPYPRALSGVQKRRHSLYPRIFKDSANQNGRYHPSAAEPARVFSRQELAQQVTYLKTENKILRSKLPDRVQLNNQERRRLVKHVLELGARIKDLISVASYSTFRKWV